MRGPLLDYEIVRFGLSLPDEFLHDGKRGKIILRSLVERYLPASLFSRPKQGFTPPVSAWFRTSHANATRGLARSERFADLGWFSRAFIEALASEHVAGNRDNSERLFALLVLDQWLKDHG